MPHEVDILDLINRRVIITTKGLEQLQDHIRDLKTKSLKLRIKTELKSEIERNEVPYI